ncbi:MAG: TonB-dependent receptor [Candidatus Solibacter usitatus]|nr:TonB-dependent receptor [Candidatus Solibacter usitatus]
MLIRVVTALLSFLPFAFSQTTGSATLVGTVTDSTGAVIAGAKVAVVNTATSFVAESVTNSEGSYYVPYLSPGPYRLTLEAAGFKKHVRDGISLRTNETPRIDVRMEVGAVSDTISVEGTAPLLETETAAAGQIMEGSTVIKLPVMQKGVKRMTLYMPGVNVINGLHADGQRERALGVTLDGMSGKEPVRGAVNDDQRIMTGTLDMIQEFKMMTTGLPAEFGHSGAGILSAVYKSGTNSFHGSAEDRYLNGALVHRQYFDQLKRCDVGLPCNPWGYHEMSATLGGPVYIPKIYNGKNKTFWFFGFQRHHEKVSETAITNVPTPEMYGGDFSFGGRGFPIYDPSTTRQDSTGRWLRDPFAGNRLPVSQIDPVVKKFLSFNPWTQANRPGVITPTGVTQDLVLPTKGRYFFTRYDNKVDHQFSTNHRVFGRLSRMRNRAPGRYSTDIAWDVYDPVMVQPNDFTNIVFSDTYTFSPTLISEFRLGYNRRHETKDPISYGQGFAAQLGMPNAGATTFPRFVTGYNGGPGGRFQNISEDNTLQENLTKVVSRHTLKFGYEMVRTRYNALAEALPSGIYNMGGTELPFTPNTGNTFASFLLGNVASAQFTRNQATWLPRWWGQALYLQDDFRPMKNLTLNIGLRWSYESPFSTKYGQQSQFDPTAIDPITKLPGAITHKTGQLARKDLNNFQPRLGLAWNFRPNFVFRSSFTLISIDLMTNDLNQNFEEYLASANIQSPTGDPRTAFKLSQGPPAVAFTTNADGSVPYVGTNYASRNATWYDPNMRTPYVMNWSGGVQWQFTKTWLMEAMYQGSAGVKLMNTWNINVLPISAFPYPGDPARTEQMRQQFQNFKPYTQFGNVNLVSNFGHNTYHAATLRFEKRYSRGMTLNSFYTWSKTISNSDDDGTASGITYYNRSLEKARASYDIHHRWVTTLTYELPFGKGRSWLNGGGVKNALLGGWEMVWIQTFQTGPPFTVTQGGSPSNYLPGVGNRPNQILPNDQVKLAHVDIGPNRFPFAAQNRYLNINGFAYPAAYTIGALGRNTLEAPGVIWPQTSVQKTWTMFERIRFTLRGDVNNIFKYHNFNPPNSTFNRTDQSSFGTFTGTRGSFSDIGTGRWHTILVFRLQW